MALVITFLTLIFTPFELSNIREKIPGNALFSVPQNAFLSELEDVMMSEKIQFPYTMHPKADIWAFSCHMSKCSGKTLYQVVGLVR